MTRPLSAWHSSLSFRKFFPFLAIILLVILLAFWGITRFYFLAIESHTQEMLSSCKQFTLCEIKELTDNAGLYAHYIATSWVLSDSLSNPAAKRAINTPLAEFLKENHMEVSAYAANSGSTLPFIVHKGLAGLDVAEFMNKLQPGGQPALKLDMVHPIRDGSGQVEKVVLISRTLDEEFLNRIKQNINADVSLIFDGRITLTTLAPDLKEMLNRAILPLVSKKNYVPAEKYYSEFEYKNKVISTLLFSLPNSGSYNGIVAVSIMPHEMAITREVFWRGTVFILMTLVILILLTYTVFSMLIISPVKELSAAVKEISNGNLDWQFEINPKDELGEVKTALNAIVLSLKKSRQEIQSLHQQLEDKVNLRTQILLEQNQRLRFSDKKLKGILDQSEVGIFHLERNLNLGYLNATVAKLCGLPRENMLRQPINDFINFPKPDEAMTCLEQILEGQIGEHVFHAHLICHDKSLLNINIQCGPFYIDDEIVGIRGVIWEANS